MVDVLVILDGACEAPGAPDSTLQEAYTPALDRLVCEGRLTWLQTVAPGLPVGSETAIAGLLGWRPRAPVDRGAIEAAARGIVAPAGHRAWRVDVTDGRGGRGGETAAAAAAAQLRVQLCGHAVHEIGGHRLLLLGPAPLPRMPAGLRLRVWPEGARPPRMLDHSTVVIGAAGAAIGLARLLGAAAVVPPGATGRPDSDLAAKSQAALAAIAAGAHRVVVHVGGADEASHDRDRPAKIAVIETADRDVIGPLMQAVRAVAGQLRVCPDHGCDPSTGEHLTGPVPHVSWSASLVPA